MRPVGIPLKVLNVEDSEDDALLLCRHLVRAGYDVTMERVDTPAAMEEALAQPGWDVVIADYVLPRFSAPAALALVKERRPGLPFLLVSGAVGEETVAMAALRAGAHDYLLKNSLPQFVDAVALTAGVIPEAQRGAVHLRLGKEYLTLEPEPNLAKATYHGEEALSLLKEGDPLYPEALLHLGRCYTDMGQEAEAGEMLQRYEALTGVAGGTGTVAVGAGLSRAPEAAPAEDRWAAHLERAKYLLLGGDLGQAVTEAITALHLAGSDSVRCFECHMLLLKLAQKQGHGREALNFGISARMMAVEAGRHDLGYGATEALADVVGNLGDQAGELLQQVEREYRKWGLDIWQYLPDPIQRIRN
jgi:CheY-like chemotaxis protein